MGPVRALACAVAVLLQLTGCSADESPDVVLVTLDTLRPDHLGAYGYAGGTSPRIDQFAAESARYTRAWSTSPWTLPAHASMLTGKHPTSHGAHFDARGGEASLSEVTGNARLRLVRVNRLAEEHQTLAELLHARGYRTAAFAGGPWLSPAFGLLQGYEVQDAEVGSLAGRSARELSDGALAFIEATPRSRPIHLLLNYYDAHDPYEPPAEFRPNPTAGAVGLYDGEIRFVDREIGRLFDGLRAAGRYDAALIILVSDHGELFGEHGLYRHPNWHYEELLRVAWIVRRPGGRGAGERIDAPVSIVDLLPLIAAELGLELPGAVEGVPVGSRDLVVAESFRDLMGIRMHGDRMDRDLASAVRWPWKLTTSDRGESHLYRLDEDPGELREIDDPELEASLARELASRRAGFRPPAKPAKPRVSPEMRERLRALGYLE